MVRLFSLLSQGKRQHTVVRRDEEIPGGLNSNGFARAADTRINDGDMDCAPGEEWAARREGEGASADVTGRDAMSYVNDLNSRREPGDYAFHGADEPVGEAEVSSEGDQSTKVETANAESRNGEE
jgi:hypothetical protein